jgi:nucleotide-binding universal stress UspA family protein
MGRSLGSDPVDSKLKREVIKMTEKVPGCPLTRGERILVALDGSENSERALDQALSMATICKSKLFVVSVVDLYAEVIAEAPDLEEKMSEKAEKTLEWAKQKAEKKNISCETIVHIGRPVYEFIVKEAQERKIDLIVMGKHGRTGLKRLLMGSVAERVIGHAHCAVMIIPS